MTKIIFNESAFCVIVNSKNSVRFIVKILFSIIVFILLNSFCLAQKDLSLQAENVEKEYQEALSLVEEGTSASFLAAKVKFEKVLDFFSKNESQISDKAALAELNTYKSSCLLNLGMIWKFFGESQKALDHLGKALLIARQYSDLETEGKSLSFIGGTYLSLGENQKARDYLLQALSIAVRINSKEGETAILSGIAATYIDSGDYAKALEYSNKSLAIIRQTEDKEGEALTLNVIGKIYSSMGEYQKALEYIKQALEIDKQSDDLKSQSLTLNNLGRVYNFLGKNEDSLSTLKMSLQISERIGDQEIQFLSLNNIGMVYASLGETGKASEYLERALQIIRQRASRVGEAYALNNLGGVFYQSGDNKTALLYFEQALRIAQGNDLKKIEAMTTQNMGLIYSSQGESQKAIQYLERSLTLAKQIGDKESESVALHNIGQIYSDAGDQRKALQYYNESLPLTKELGDKSGEAALFGSMMYAWKILGNNNFAAFYGKQSVNLYQELRSNIRGLDEELQTTYLKTVSDAYRDLADILVAQGRLFEAEQVLALLKEDENFKFVRRDASEVEKLLRRVDLRDSERKALERYKLLGDKLGALGAEFSKLQELQANGIILTSDQQTRFKQLEKDIEDSGTVFQVFLRALEEEFAKKTDVSKEIEENKGLQSDLKSYGEGVVALYTLVNEERYRVILTTSEIQIDGKTDIPAAKLNKKIEDFLRALQNPNADPRPLGQELYDIIIKPVETQLAGAKTKTILWSLDGTLRYIPVAALWDGKQYFGQKYQNVIISLSSRTRLGEQSNPNPKTLGLGVSQAKEVIEADNKKQTFPSLPGVKDELTAIIRETEIESGVLQGTRFLDDRFTEETLKTNLGRGFKVIHIATHFKLGLNDVSSYLLLGDGQALTVEKIRKSPSLKFNGADLVTLSACNTSRGIEGNGREIEGLSYVIQQNGARAILASLWAVADESTSLLMSEFYRLRKENPALTKAGAIQQAQKEMIEGKLKSQTAEGVRRAEVAGVNNGSFRYEADKPFAHPYYWSPFVLIGNWR